MANDSSYVRNTRLVTLIQTGIIWISCIILLLTGADLYIEGVLGQPLAWAAFLLGWNLLLLPGEWVAGHTLPHRYGRKTSSFISWLGQWSRAAGIQALYFFASGIAGLWVAGWTGIWGLAGWMVLQMLLLAGLQYFMALAMCAYTHSPYSDRGRIVLELEHEDRGLTGGIYGIPGQESIVMPAYWRRQLGEKAYQALLIRRHGAINTGIRGLAFFIALGWNVLLFVAALLLSRWGGQTEISLIRVCCLFTCFSVLGYLVLPASGRRAVFQLDRWAYFQRQDADVLREAITGFHRLQDEQSSHALSPLPDAAQRLAALQTQKDQKGAWQVFSLARYLSWAGYNLMNRTGFSLTGKPARWVFAPAD